MKIKLTAAFLVLAVLAFTLGTNIGPRPADAVRMQSTTDYQIQLMERSRI